MLLYLKLFFLKVNWKSANETCERRNMKLISINSLEEESRILKLVKNTFGKEFWTAEIRETQILQRSGENWVISEIKCINCVVFRRRQYLFEYKLFISDCNSEKYSICYRESKDEDDDYDCDD